VRAGFGLAGASDGGRLEVLARAGAGIPRLVQYPMVSSESTRSAITAASMI